MSVSVFVKMKVSLVSNSNITFSDQISNYNFYRTLQSILFSSMYRNFKSFSLILDRTKNDSIYTQNQNNYLLLNPSTHHHGVLGFWGDRKSVV